MAKNVWGIIAIVVGVLMAIVGLVTFVDVYNQAQQLETTSNMMGGLMGNDGTKMMNAFAAMSGVDLETEIRNGYIKSGLTLLVGVGISVFGTKLLSKKNKQHEIADSQTV